MDSGLYAKIRHPLYLGNLLLFLACPAFLAGRLSWLAAVLAIAGLILRIHIEEKFLLGNTDGYQDYIQRTWALIPYLY